MVMIAGNQLLQKTQDRGSLKLLMELQYNDVMRAKNLNSFVIEYECFHFVPCL